MKKKIAILTDNDNKNRDDLIKLRGLEDMPNCIQIFTDNDFVNNTTIEPCFINSNKNKIQQLSNAVRKKTVENDTIESLEKYMKNNKTQWHIEFCQI